MHETHPVPKHKSEMHVWRIWLKLLYFPLVARMWWRLRHFQKHFLPLLLHFLLLFLLMLCAGKPGFPGNPSFPGAPWKKELSLNWFVAKRGLRTPIKSHYHNDQKVRKSSKYDWWSKITSYFVVLLITPWSENMTSPLISLMSITARDVLITDYPSIFLKNTVTCIFVCLPIVSSNVIFC